MEEYHSNQDIDDIFDLLKNSKNIAIYGTDVESFKIFLDKLNNLLGSIENTSEILSSKIIEYRYQFSNDFSDKDKAFITKTIRGVNFKESTINLDDYFKNQNSSELKLKLKESIPFKIAFGKKEDSMKIDGVVVPCSLNNFEKKGNTISFRPEYRFIILLMDFLEELGMRNKTFLFISDYDECDENLDLSREFKVIPKFSKFNQYFQDLCLELSKRKPDNEEIENNID